MNRHARRRCVGAFAAVVALLALTGCGVRPSQETAPIVPQEAFVERFNAVCDTGATIPLRSLTTVVWDRVSLFPEGTLAEKYEEETGHKARLWAAHGTVTPADYLMVLQNEGEIVEMVIFLPGKIFGNRDHPSFSYDADVLVRMTETDYGCFGELVPAQFADEGTDE